MSFLKSLKKIVKSPEVQIALVVLEITVFLVREIFDEDNSKPPQTTRR